MKGVKYLGNRPRPGRCGRCIGCSLGLPRCMSSVVIQGNKSDGPRHMIGDCRLLPPGECLGHPDGIRCPKDVPT